MFFSCHQISLYSLNINYVLYFVTFCSQLLVTLLSCRKSKINFVYCVNVNTPPQTSEAD